MVFKNHKVHFHFHIKFLFFSLWGIFANKKRRSFLISSCTCLFCREKKMKNQKVCLCVCFWSEWVRTKLDLGLSSQIRVGTETWFYFVKKSNLELVSQYYLGVELESRFLKKIVLKKKWLELPVDQSLNHAINCWLQSGLVRTKSK